MLCQSPAGVVLTPCKTGSTGASAAPIAADSAIAWAAPQLARCIVGGADLAAKADRRLDDQCALPHSAAALLDVPVVVHCFTGTEEDARAWIQLGAHLSFSGIVTFKTAEALRRAAKEAPADRILVETDCPYLAPIPYRGKRNEPAYVVETLRMIATARGISVEEAGALTVANTVRAFRLRS